MFHAVREIPVGLGTFELPEADPTHYIMKSIRPQISIRQQNIYHHFSSLAD